MSISLCARIIFVIIFIISGHDHKKVQAAELIEVFQWKQMDFYNRGRSANQYSGAIIFPDHRRYKRDDSQTRLTSRDEPLDVRMRFDGHAKPTTSTNTSSYIPYNNVPMGAAHFRGKLFITIPRRRTGIPSTLNYIDIGKVGLNRSPKLRAYPDFDTNYLSPDRSADPNKLISVYRTSVDTCNRLWFIDTGMLEYPDNRMQLQRPSIWVIDLLSDRLLNRFEIPESVASTGRGLASITVDIPQRDCERAFAYIPDLVNNRLSVYSLEGNRIWTFSHNYFHFDPLAGDLNIGGQRFRWDDGIFSVTLGPVQPNSYRNVYFHAMASNNEFVVSSEVLQNETNAARSDHGSDFRLLGSRGQNRQSTMHAFDPQTGVIFFAEINRNAVGCWNSKYEFNDKNFGTVAQNANMIYPSDLTIDNQDTMWVMTNSMPIFIYSNLNSDVINYRVWKQNVKTAVRDTVCE